MDGFSGIIIWEYNGMGSTSNYNYLTGNQDYEQLRMYISSDMTEYFQDLIDTYGVEGSLEFMENYFESDIGIATVWIVFAFLTYGLAEKAFYAIGIDMAKSWIARIVGVAVSYGVGFGIVNIYENIVEDIFDETFNGVESQLDIDNDGVNDLGIIYSVHVNDHIGISGTEDVSYHNVSCNADVWSTGNVTRFLDGKDFGTYTIIEKD
jgi:hypothetical protein